MAEVKSSPDKPADTAGPDPTEEQRIPPALAAEAAVRGSRPSERAAAAIPVLPSDTATTRQSSTKVMRVPDTTRIPDATEQVPALDQPEALADVLRQLNDASRSARASEPPPAPLPPIPQPVPAFAASGDAAPTTSRMAAQSRDPGALPYATTVEIPRQEHPPIAAPAPMPPVAHAPVVGAPVQATSVAPLAPAATMPVSAGMPVVDARPLAAYEVVTQSARLADLVALTARIVGDAARMRNSAFAFGARVRAAAEEAKLTRDDAETRFGNVLDVLSTGGETPAARALASALWAHAIAEAPRARTSEDEDRIAGDVLWLASHTAFDATPLLDRAFGEDSADLWRAIADRVRRIDAGRGGPLGRGEALVGCAALAGSGSARAKALTASLAKEVKDPALVRVLGTGEGMAPDEVRLEGELLPSPRGLFATTMLAISGLLFAVHAVRLFARFALAYRAPAEVHLSEAGVRVKTRTELLGRTLHEREHVILRSGLVRVVREVRFPRAAFYAGLLALALGSYIGIRAFADGVRSASPSLLLVGLLIVAIGIGADFVLGTLLPGSRGRCRVAFVPRSGRTLCVGDVDVHRADDALRRSLAR
jgi:hypothetical protein